jgi:hypothetical protein
LSVIDDYSVAETFKEYIPYDREIGYWPVQYFTVEEFEKKVNKWLVDKKK